MKINLIKKYLSSVNKILRKNFKKLEENDLKYFRSFLDGNQIEEENLDIYNIDWIKKYKGSSSLVLKPKTVNEISKVLRYCNEKKLAVVPQGGNTSLVGGSVPVFDEIIIKMTKMNKIINFSSDDFSVKCEAGCILQDLNEYVGKYDRVMPIDLGAKGSCMIGGNLATNAGGIHFIKFGSLRINCKNLTVVLPNGDIVNLNLKDLKNSYGCDLSKFWVGSEGTLGIISEAEIYTGKLYKNKSLSITGLNSFESVVELYLKAKNHFGTDLTAIEFFDSGCLEIMNQSLNMIPLFDNNANKFQFYVLMENSSNLNDSLDNMASFMEKNDLDGLISDDTSKMQELWEYREKIAVACCKGGIVFKYDVSLPLEQFYSLVEDIKNKIGPLAKTVGYGHIGDYNLHLNICHENFDMDNKYHVIESILEPYIFDYLKSINGSISAEHGIGVAKSEFLDRSQTSNNIQLMKKIKNSIDPNGIMNPYKLFI